MPGSSSTKGKKHKKGSSGLSSVAWGNSTFLPYPSLIYKWGGSVVNSIPDFSSLSTGPQVQKTSTLKDLQEKKFSIVFYYSGFKAKRNALFSTAVHSLVMSPVNACVHAVVPVVVQLFVTPWIVALQAPLSMEVFQARILGRVAMPSCRESSRRRDLPRLQHCRQILYCWASREAHHVIHTHAKSYVRLLFIFYKTTWHSFMFDLLISPDFSVLLLARKH